MKYAFLTMWLVLSGILMAQSDLILNVDGRQTKSLNGEWRIIIDPYENGFYDYRYKEYDSGYFKDAQAHNKWDRVEYNFNTADQLYVPGDWNSQRDDLLFYEGTIWYRQKFDYDIKADKRVFVYFGAANYEAIVYLNGEKLGKHVGGFTPFNFEITSKLQKTNSLVVKVDNKRYRDAVPTVNTDWWNYGGLTRRVMLIETPKTFIRDYHIQLAKGSGNKISGWVHLDGVQKQQTMTFEIPELKLETAVQTDRKGVAVIDVTAKPQLWSPENPKLYDIVLSCNTDQVEA
jgi:beta-glucuronidase